MATTAKKTKKPLDYSIKRKVVIAEAIIRPTGLLDPEIIVKPVSNQVDDVLERVRQRVSKGQRVLITTLTKKFAEELDLYFKQINIKSAYIHSDVETIERIDILSDLRRGRYDVLIGINLLREGLDLPEVSLVAIFDADKEGFLRSRTSLIQIIGRAARHVEGQVIMYADTITASMRQAIEETERRRTIQMQYNHEHGIIPQTTQRHLHTIADDLREEIEKDENFGAADGHFTPLGWQEKESDLVQSQKKWEEQFVGQKDNPSIHGPDKIKTNVRGRKSKQVYSDFDSQKNTYLSELESLNLNQTELHQRLRIAIDAMNFEEAAAIRDLIAKGQ